MIKFRNNNNKSGFTLAEAMIAVVILGFAAAGVLLPFAAGAAMHAEGARRTAAAKIAADLMEEIIATDYDDIVGIYDGYSEAPGRIRKASSDGYGGSVVYTASDFYSGDVYNDLSRKAFCEYVTVSGAEAILVTVKVYYKADEIVNIKTLVSR